METIVRTANNLVDKSDRWLFLAALLVLGGCAFMALRWLVSKFEKGQEQLATLTGEAIKTNERLAVVLDRNNGALEENTARLRTWGGAHP